MAKSITVQRRIAAPVERVFQTVATPAEFCNSVPQITNIEFLSDQTTGVGTRFRETRLMKGKEHATELEITEHVDNDHVRIVSDAGGTIWDTVFSVEVVDAEHTDMTMVMDARPYKLAAKVATPMLMKMIAKFVEADMDEVKKYCEQA